MKFLSIFFITLFLSASDIDMLKKAYPNHVAKIENSKIYFFDGSFFEYDLNVQTKNYEELLNNNDLKSQLMQKYEVGNSYKIVKNYDPGRIRFQPFFEKIYGKTVKEREKHLVQVSWLPTIFNQQIRVTTINGVDKKLKAISDELEILAKNKDKKFLECLSADGGYIHRVIAKTNRLSMHSFGIAVDIGVKCSNYWQWDSDYKTNYKNSFPLEIVNVFEKYGFIWGGKWYHYDTMHFEYRPELF